MQILKAMYSVDVIGAHRRCNLIFPVAVQMIITALSIGGSNGMRKLLLDDSGMAYFPPTAGSDLYCVRRGATPL